MAIHILSPLYLSEKGKRSNNEDAIFPDNATTQTRLFVVCDGVGGSEKGEVASHLAATSFYQYCTENDLNSPKESTLHEALIYAEQKFSEHIAQHSETKGMGTTLVCLWLGNEQALVAWCGDSRLYQFRNGNIIFKTDDHSLVNQLLKNGDLTEEEAENFPQKNVILRAIAGSEKPTQLQVSTLTDLAANDIFLLCTDGVTEKLSDAALEMIVSQSNDNLVEIKQLIQQYCLQHSNDNYSFHLIGIEQVGSEKEATIETEKTTVSTSTTHSEQPTPAQNVLPERRAKSNSLLFTLLGVFLLLAAIGGWYAWQQQQKNVQAEVFYKKALGFETEGSLDSALVYYQRANTISPQAEYEKAATHIGEKLTTYHQYNDKITNIKKDIAQNLDQMTSILSLLGDSSLSKRKDSLMLELKKAKASLDVTRALLVVSDTTSYDGDSLKQESVLEKRLLGKDTLAFADAILNGDTWLLTAQTYIHLLGKNDTIYALNDSLIRQHALYCLQKADSLGISKARDLLQVIQ